MDRAKQTSIKDLRERKYKYKDALINDDREIRALKKEIDEQQSEQKDDLEKLAD